MKKIAIFASGNGSNAENIIQYFKEKGKDAEVALIICNRKEAGVYQRAERLGVPSLHVPKAEINDPARMKTILRENRIDFIVLAGFLLMVPEFILSLYPRRIVNIHPSLLPRFGGKGMHGSNVHEAVISAGEKESGITIHYVTEEYDAGEIIFQAKTTVNADDDAGTLESKIHDLEKLHYPAVIDKLVSELH